MRKKPITSHLKHVLLVLILVISNNLIAQQQPTSSKYGSDFWDKVQIGGGLGLGFGSGYTDISISPSAIYNFNDYVALGAGVQYSYVSLKNNYSSNLYGGSIIALFNPIREIQLSAELEELRVNTTYNGIDGRTDNFWNTGLFLGAGYRSNNVTIGARYNVLHDDNNRIYNDAFMPFVRVYF